MLAEAGYDASRTIGALREAGAVEVSAKPGLKISELADASGVSAGTIKHYLREGLLPEPVKTSRNMAYYPPEFVDRIRTIKRLQEERFMPLRLIREVLEQADRPRTSRARCSSATTCRPTCSTASRRSAC